MSQIPPAALICPTCFQEFRTDEDLAEHVGREHPPLPADVPMPADDTEMPTDG
jgi:hypothetical protein